MIKDNIRVVRERIEKACVNIGRDPSSLSIVAVSKGRTIEEAREAIEAGITDIGENRVREAVLKFNALRIMPSVLRGGSVRVCDGSYKLRTHMVGHLQTNKVKDAVRIFDLIQSVDSLRLAREIDKQAAKINKVQDILIEVKSSDETGKFGLKPEEAIDIIKEISQLKNICIKGLMTIAPMKEEPEKTRPYFKMLRELKDKINELNRQNGLNELNVLSMGMSDDFQIALEEGANMIRLGRAIFAAFPHPNLSNRVRWTGRLY